MTLRLITADERLSESRRKTTVAIFGPSNIGKTRLALTLKRPTLFVEMEAGMASIEEDYRGGHIRPQTIEDLAEIGCLMAGPDYTAKPDAFMSVAHYEAVISKYGKSLDLSPYRVLFIDSITVMSRWMALWAAARPESFTDKGVPNNFGKFNLIATEMIRFLTHFQRAPGLDVVFVGILEKRTDDFGRTTFDMQLEGGKTGRELPGIMDVVITMDTFKLESAGVRHAPGEPLDEAGTNRIMFMCKALNPFSLPGKDRRKKLDLFEPPDLGALLDKAAPIGQKIVTLPTAS